MSDTLILLHTGIAIAGIVALILWLRVEAVLALVIGSMYLGLATGLGFGGTAQTIAQGFGDIMADIGLLIAFGVLIGSLLAATGTLQRLTEALLRIFGPERAPYAFSVSMSNIFPAIYTDVLLVLTAPLGRSIAPRLRRNGTAAMGAALVLGSEVGLVLVVPGAGALAVAALLDVPLGTMLLGGLAVGVPTAAISMFVYRLLLNRGLWNPSKDEAEFEELAEADAPVAEQVQRRLPPLGVALSPLLVALVLIASGAIAGAAGFESGVLAFFGDPLVALFIGVLGSYLLAWRTLSNEQAGNALGDGLRELGAILVITGIGGSLGAVISESGLESVLGSYFSAGMFAPLLLAWLVGVILHVAIGSTSVAAITAAGILAPVIGNLEVSTLLIALAAGSGALFAVHVNSNFFWMFQRLMGLTTQGALKTCTLVTMIASVVSLFCVLALSVVV